MALMKNEIEVGGRYNTRDDLGFREVVEVISIVPPSASFPRTVWNCRTNDGRKIDLMISSFVSRE